MSIEPAELANFYPLDKLLPENLQQLALDAVQQEASRGSALFRAGDVDDDSIFLREGQVSGEYPDGRHKNIDARTLQGRYALGDTRPRRFTATVTSSNATVVRLDRRYIEKVQTWDQLSRTENFRHVDPSPDANRWVFRLLQSRALHRLPTGSIERMFTRFEEIQVASGDVIIREGDAADYYYAIKDGAASVTKKLDTGSSVVAYLVRGDTFGEDALLANTLRNATVTMIKDGRLMRLAKKAFEEVLMPPIVDWLTPAEASAKARQGAILIDVRMPAEHAQRAIKSAVNLPLYTLRESIADYDRTKDYIVYCNTGERSAAAAFILGQMGFRIYALLGGLSGMIRRKQRNG